MRLGEQELRLCGEARIDRLMVSLDVGRRRSALYGLENFNPRSGEMRACSGRDLWDDADLGETDPLSPFPVVTIHCTDRFEEPDDRDDLIDERLERDDREEREDREEVARGNLNMTMYHQRFCAAEINRTYAPTPQTVLVGQVAKLRLEYFKSLF